VPSIVLERPLFVREQSDGLYRVVTYLLFKLTEEFLVAFINSIVFANIGVESCHLGLCAQL
jgi:hypothetical protein